MTARPPVRLLADCEWIHEPPPRELIDGLRLTAGGLAEIWSAPGCGKTFVSTSLATAFAIAPDWLGHRIPTPGPVVYAAGEGHAAFPLRLGALRAGYGLRDAEPSGVWYVREPFSLLQPDDVTAVLDGIRHHLAGEAPGLFVIDPLAAYMEGGDENSTQDMSIVTAALRRIRDETKACVLVDHHAGWTGERERGSIVLRAAMDLVYQLEQEDGVITMTCVKLRDGVTPEPLRLQLRPVAGSCVVDRAGAADTEIVTQLTARQQHVLDTLKAIVVDEPVSYSRWKEAAGVPEVTFYRASALLVKSGYILKVGKGRSARYAPPGPLTSITSISPPSDLHGGESHLHSPPGAYIRPRSGGNGSPPDTDVPF